MEVKASFLIRIDTEYYTNVFGNSRSRVLRLCKLLTGLLKTTVKRYTNVIHYFSKHSRVEIIEGVQEENLRAFFFNGRVNCSWSNATYISYYFTLQVFFDWCIQKKLMTVNPMEKIELPKLEKRIPSKLTKQVTLKLLEVVCNYPYPYQFLRYRNHAIFSMFVFAGLRKNELFNLKLTDVDIENLSIFVHLGKGNKDRIVPMSNTLAHVLKRYLQERKRLNKTCPEFFASHNRNQGFTNDGLKHVVDDLRKASGILFTIHS